MTYSKEQILALESNLTLMIVGAKEMILADVDQDSLNQIIMLLNQLVEVLANEQNVTNYKVMDFIEIGDLSSNDLTNLNNLVIEAAEEIINFAKQNKEG